MEYVVDTKVEMTNVRNNVAFMMRVCVEAEENNYDVVMTHYYEQFKRRLDSALKSMFTLYQNADINYSSLNLYLASHEKVLAQLTTLLVLSGERDITGNDREFVRLLWHVDNLNELAQGL